MNKDGNAAASSAVTVANMLGVGSKAAAASPPHPPSTSPRSAGPARSTRQAERQQEHAGIVQRVLNGKTLHAQLGLTDADEAGVAWAFELTCKQLDTTDAKAKAALDRLRNTMEKARLQRERKMSYGRLAQGNFKPLSSGTSGGSKTGMPPLIPASALPSSKTRSSVSAPTRPMRRTSTAAAAAATAGRGGGVAGGSQHSVPTGASVATPSGSGNSSKAGKARASPRTSAGNGSGGSSSSGGRPSRAAVAAAAAGAAGVADTSAGSGGGSAAAAAVAPDRPTQVLVPEGVVRFGEIREVWEALVEREGQYVCNSQYLLRHPSVLPKMRALLADWLIEVCEEFVLHRETYYMALNFVDRYLTAKANVKKSNLQAIGVTTLFMAAKIQEIYPPPITMFVDITDRSVSDEAVLQMELDILTVLKWKLCPVTVTTWLELYLQADALPVVDTTIVEAFSKPKYHKPGFYRVCQLMDLCSLDYASIRFPPSVLAACAIHLAIGGKDFSEMIQHTGYSMAQLQPCLDWMRRFSNVLNDGQHFVAQPRMIRGRVMHKVPPEDVHNIQSHCNSFKWFEEATEAPRRPKASAEMTPPPSTRKAGGSGSGNSNAAADAAAAAAAASGGPFVGARAGTSAAEMSAGGAAAGKR